MPDSKMPPWAKEVEEAQPGAARKVRVQGASKEDTEEVISVLTKQVLANTQEQRMVAPLIYRTINMKESSSYYKHARTMLNKYNNKVEKATTPQESEDAGEPFWWAFLGLLIAVEEDSRQTPEGKSETAQALTDMQDDKSKAEDWVKLCKIKNAYGEGNRKLVIECTTKGQALEKAIVQGIVREGGRRPRGQAPRGANERYLQNWLEGRKPKGAA
jgi:hypothetical protein